MDGVQNTLTRSLALVLFVVLAGLPASANEPVIPFLADKEFVGQVFGGNYSPDGKEFYFF